MLAIAVPPAGTAEGAVVALTSFAEEDRVHAVLDAGAPGYLLKEADADEPIAAIRAAHHGERTLDPALPRRLMASLRAPPGTGPRRMSSPAASAWLLHALGGSPAIRGRC